MIVRLTTPVSVLVLAACGVASVGPFDRVDDQQLLDVVRYGGRGADTIDAAAIATDGTRLLVVRHSDALDFDDRRIAEGRGTTVFAHRADALRFAWTIDSALNVVRAAAMPDGGWVVSAGFFGAFDHPQSEQLVSRGAHDTVLMRLDDTGRVLWTRQLFADGDTFLNGVAPDGRGNVFVAGRFAGALEIASERLEGVSGDDAFLAKFTPSGEVTWLRPLASEGNDTIGAVVVTRTQGVLVGGAFSESLVLDAAALFAPRSAYLAQFDADGRVAQARTIGGPDTEIAALAIDESNGDVVIGATFTGTFTIDDVSKRSRGQTDIAYARLDRELRYVHLERFGGALLDVVEDLTIDRFGWPWIVGTVRGDEPTFGPTVDESTTDAIILGFSPNDAPRFVYRVGGEGDQVGAAIGAQGGVLHVVGLFRGATVGGLPSDPESFSLFGVRLVAR